MLLNMFPVRHLLLFETRRQAAKKRVPKERVHWNLFCDYLSSNQFRPMLSMPKSCFGVLCSVIINMVGEEEPKSQFWIDTVLEAETGPEGSFLIARKTFM